MKRPASRPPPARSARASAMPSATPSPANGRRTLQHRRAHDFRSPRHRLAGDGCLQEGVAQGGRRLRRAQRLDNLILIYDSNDVTLDAMADGHPERGHRGLSPRNRLGRGDHRRPRPRRHRRRPSKGAKRDDNGKAESSSSPRRSSARASPKSPAPPRATARAARSSPMPPAPASACPPTSTSTSARKPALTSPSTKPQKRRGNAAWPDDLTPPGPRPIPNSPPNSTAAVAKQSRRPLRRRSRPSRRLQGRHPFRRRRP
jgi:hypothetical protein